MSRMSSVSGNGIDWSEIAERRIDEAIERGEFDNLPGRGKPVNLDRNPLLDPSMEIAFKILQDHDFAPDWIMGDKDLRMRVRKWRELLRAEWEGYQARLDSARRLQPPWDERRRLQASAAWSRRWEELQQEMQRINREIDALNLKIPMDWLHRARLRAERELERVLRGVEVSDGSGEGRGSGPDA